MQMNKLNTKRNIFFNSILFLLSLFFFFLFAEVVLRLLIVPADHAYGKLFGKKLPPMDVVPWSLVKTKEQHLARRHEWAHELIVDGKRITYGDLGFIFKEDRLLGYVPETNHRSSNDWVRTNSMGARSDKEFSYEIPEGKRRILLYGDSFTAGMRLPQEKIWAYSLEKKDINLEVVNFGVGGFGMGQAYLLFKRTQRYLKYHDVFLTIVPTSDLFRDINLIRFLGSGWDSYGVNSRFVVENNELKLIEPPYDNVHQMVAANRDGLTDVLREHLEKYEPYYFPKLSEEVPFFGKSIFYKLFLLGVNTHRHNSIRRTLMDPESEAMQVNQKIFEAMNRDVIAAGSRFVVIILPRDVDVKKHRWRPGFIRRWNAMVQFFLSEDYEVWNLMEELKEVSDEDLDLAYDNTHYGERASQQISHFIWERYRKLNKT